MYLFCLGATRLPSLSLFPSSTLPPSTNSFPRNNHSLPQETKTLTRIQSPSEPSSGTSIVNLLSIAIFLANMTDPFLKIEIKMRRIIRDQLKKVLELRNAGIPSSELSKRIEKMMIRVLSLRVDIPRLLYKRRMLKGKL
ncbi:hypothetical protein VTJ04DRAFT_1859 [Mycothermus thermophilus]|uniref:uncharacterized protein n=1 Tax=Humicola insolens TaxID=85995 RepID=UPI00374220B3